MSVRKQDGNRMQLHEFIELIPFLMIVTVYY